MSYASNNKNYFAIWVTIAVVIVTLGIGTIVVIGNNAATSPGTPPDSKIVNSDTGAISFGDGDQVLDTYVDFMCPACGNFEDAYGPGIREQINDGTLTLNVHPISILDRMSVGSKFSTRSASAMYCVAENDPDAAMSYFQMLFANQPEENTEGWANADLVRFAEQSGAVNSSSCIEDETFSKYVTALTKDTPLAPGASSITTPTVMLDDEYVTLTGDVDADLFSKMK